MKKIIFLDFGHGGGECGAVANGLIEKNLNLKYGLILKKRLEEHGFKVICTRTTDIKISLTGRANIMNKQCDDDDLLCVSYHHNGFVKTARGSETYRSIHNSKSTRVSKFCDFFLTEMKNLGFLIRGNKTKESETHPGQDYYTIIQKTKMKTIIIEPYFLTNKEDVEQGQLLQYEIIECFVKSICWYYNIKYIPIKEESNITYCVQVGAFKNKNNALKLVTELKNKGFTSIIKTQSN